MFDDPNLVSVAGLVPMLRLARSAGLDELAQSRLSVPTDKGANAGGKVMALVAGMLAGADSIDDMNLLRHGGMGRLFDRTYAPSTLGSSLREFRFGHVRQLDAVASRTLVNLASAAPLLQIRDGERVMVDVDDTIIEVHGYQKHPAVKTAIATMPEGGWETIEYPNAIRDEVTGRWISKAEVAEVPFTAFRSRKITERVEGRLLVRQIPDLNPNQVEQPTLFDSYRHHALFTTTDKQTMGTVAADKTHRGHAIIEQVHADLKAGPLAHLPSGVFTANSAWLVLAVIAFNLTRAAGLIADRGGRLARATTATIHRTLISVPARLARTARRIILHLPDAWPWQTAFDRLFTATHAPPPAAASCAERGGIRASSDAEAARGVWHNRTNTRSKGVADGRGRTADRRRHRR